MKNEVPILTKAMKKYLLSASKKGYKENVQSAYNRRIVEYARKGIEDLVLLVEKLPEELQAKIFNEEMMLLLMRIMSFRLTTKIAIEEKDESQGYRPIPLEQLLQMIKNKADRVEIFVPNVCGGETRITIYKDVDYVA